MFLRPLRLFAAEILHLRGNYIITRARWRSNGTGVRAWEMSKSCDDGQGFSRDHTVKTAGHLIRKLR